MSQTTETGRTHFIITQHLQRLTDSSAVVLRKLGQQKIYKLPAARRQEIRSLPVVFTD